MQHSTPIRIAAFLSCGCLLLFSGCASPRATQVVANASGSLASFPAAAAAGAQNTYTGTDSLQVWTLSVDDNARTWQYSSTQDAITLQGGLQQSAAVAPLKPPASGTLSAIGGFQSLGTAADGTPLGLMLEVPGRLVLLRPGGPTTTLVIAVPQATCYSLPDKLRLQYLDMDVTPGGSNSPATLSTGSVVVNTNTDGTKLNFEELTGNTALGPGSFTGTCGVNGGLASWTIPSNQILNSTNNNQAVAIIGIGTDPVKTSIGIGPTGIVVARQLQANSLSSEALYSTGITGFAEPPVALTASNINTFNYLGFMSESILTGTDSQSSQTYYLGGSSPVAFSPDPTTKLPTGGAFQNDDPTQATLGNTVINLHTESTSLNGYYPSATITRPDPNQLCSTSYSKGASFDASGSPICTFPAIAMVGQSDGKYVIFLNAHDYTVGSFSTNPNGTSLQMYLYQQ